MSRALAIAQATALLDTGAFERTLATWVRERTESQRLGSANVIGDHLRGVLWRQFAALGFSCRLILNPEDGPPFLIAERMEDARAPTVLGYAHADVIRGQDDRWDAGLEPWHLVTRSGRFYGRGTADNKGQLAINLGALGAVIEARGGSLGWNVRYLVEGGEELGSPGLHAVCREHADLLAADFLLASDGPRLSSLRPTIFLGTRGARNFVLRTAPRAAAHHSGNWGGLLSNPAVILSHAIATLVDSSGRIKVEALRPAPITEEVRALLAACPAVQTDVDPAIDPDWGEPGLSPAERLYGWNSLEVLACGAGELGSVVSAIPGSAVAHCQLRFVVGTDGDDVLPAVRRALDDAGLTVVEVLPTNDIPFAATRTPADNRWVRLAMDSIAETTGQPPVLLPNFGGSLPNDAFATILGLPTIWVPHSYPGCNQHAPNEHLPLHLARDGLAIMAGLYWDLGMMRQAEWDHP